jgi:hypothetical protein
MFLDFGTHTDQMGSEPHHTYTIAGTKVAATFEVAVFASAHAWSSKKSSFNHAS